MDSWRGVTTSGVKLCLQISRGQLTNTTKKIQNKKIEMAMINTLQLVARKNLIQISSDVINYTSNCHSGLSRHLSTTCLDYFVFPYLKNNVFKNKPGTIPELMQVITDNCNLTDFPGATLRRSFENMQRRE
jgi:hypothetical protein